MPQAEETTYVIEVMPSAAEYHHHHHHHHRDDAADANLGVSRETFTSHDIDMLVSHIKENLRLSGLKSRSSLKRRMVRTAPYRLPSTWTASEPDGICIAGCPASASGNTESSDQTLKSHPKHTQHCQHHRGCRAAVHRTTGVERRLDLEDSYERFQALLRRGALIKEAVKRLQTSSPVSCETDELDGEESEDGGASGLVKRRATSTSATSTTLDSMDEEEDEEDLLYRRKRFYYDSEDEPLPTVYQPLDL